MPITPRHRAPVAALVCAASVASFTLAGSIAQAAPESDRTVTASAKPKGPTVKVMSRNVFLGADLAPGLVAGSLPELIDGAGQILNQVDANNFNKRARGLAREILNRRPDLVGLQEAALWRTAPCGSSFIPPQAEEVRYDYLEILLDRLNRKGRTYKLVAAQNQFDFEVPANTEGESGTCDINGRLTMRDAILKRVDGEHPVRTRNRSGGTFKNLTQVSPGGIGLQLGVSRGWQRVEAKVGKTGWFTFVNTHLEAFDDQTQTPSIRAKQAKELVARKGPVGSSKLPVVLVGDLNSDRKTEVQPGDAQAYNVMLDAGLRSRSARRPMSCCLGLDVLGPNAKPGARKQFDHIVDHVMTDAPRKIKLVRGFVTGRQPHRGWWSSDHAGLVSKLRFRR